MVNWDELFDGQPHQLIGEADFGGWTPETFRRKLREEAKRRGIDVTQKNTPDGLIIRAKKARKLTIGEVADQYEQLLENKLLEFVDITTKMKAAFPEWTRKYLEIFDDAGIKYKVCRQVIGDHLVFETDDPVICYFDHAWKEGKHQWVGPGFHEALSSNDALSYLSTKKGGDRDLNRKILELADKIIGCSEKAEDHDPEMN
jgi:hypothetical protein